MSLLVLRKNNKIFKSCRKQFHKNNKVLRFPIEYRKHIIQIHCKKTLQKYLVHVINIHMCITFPQKNHEDQKQKV